MTLASTKAICNNISLRSKQIPFLIYTHKESSNSSCHEKIHFTIHFIFHMIYKSSLILQHTELRNKPKQATASLTLEREGNSNTGKKITCSQTTQGGGSGGERKGKKAVTRTQAAGAQGLGRTLAPQCNRISCITAAA